VVDRFGNPIKGVSVVANYISSSLPTGVSLSTSFGVSEDVAVAMTSSGVAQAAVTGNDGVVNFLMFSVLSYTLRLTNATLGITHQVNISPQDVFYNVYVIPSSQVVGNGTASLLSNTSLWVTWPDAYHLTFCMNFQDISTLTRNVSYNVWKYGNLSTKDLGLPQLVYSYVYNETYNQIILDCNYTAPNIRGDEYRFSVNMSRTGIS
jgi:hypothetical protein